MNGARPMAGPGLGMLLTDEV